MAPTGLFPIIVLLSPACFVCLGRAGFSAGVMIGARRFEPAVEN
jgi:hypothetical protein